jgi:hypothetical protein
MDSAPRNGSEPVPPHDSQHGIAVICSRCRKIVKLDRALPNAGWQPVHQCKGHLIEALSLKAGGLLWMWRARDVKAAHQAGQRKPAPLRRGWRRHRLWSTSAGPAATARAGLPPRLVSCKEPG